MSSKLPASVADNDESFDHSLYSLVSIREADWFHDSYSDIDVRSDSSSYTICMSSSSDHSFCSSSIPHTFINNVHVCSSVSESSDLSLFLKGYDDVNLIKCLSR